MAGVISKPKILVVKEKPAVLILLIRQLTRAGCEVTAALNGKDGIKLAQGGAFHLLVLSADLPDVDVFELFQRLRKSARLQTTPVVLISGRENEANWRRGLELGAADYIEKPFHGTAFVRRVLSHLHANPERRAGHG